MANDDYKNAVDAKWVPRREAYQKAGRIGPVNEALRKIDKQTTGRVDQGSDLRAVFRARRWGKQG